MDYLGKKDEHNHGHQKSVGDCSINRGWEDLCKHNTRGRKYRHFTTLKNIRKHHGPFLLTNTQRKVY